jgi:hypothetical protein
MGRLSLCVFYIHQAFRFWISQCTLNHDVIRFVIESHLFGDIGLAAFNILSVWGAAREGKKRSKTDCNQVFDNHSL